MATIYEIADSFKLIQSLIEEGVDEDVFAEALAQNKMELSEKLEGYAMVMKNVESDIEGLKAEEKRLSDRRKSMESKIKRMKEAMHAAMSSTGEQKIQGEKFTFTIQKNPPSLKLVDDKLIPKEYFIKVDPVINRKAIMEQLKNGVEIAGVEISQGESLRIR
ncbi:siphovirus Gp157 family protein [Sporosarcina contaminans]|uniref:Siphovirus Gp157 family protein n=1 Tax=Sporosarcina contaminans TaxID=633403 RepID=A0ABW3TYK0_9BACL